MLGSRIEEQERMIELVRQGACKRVFVKAYGQE